MKNEANLITGGCQCGAVRYRVASLGRSSVCHCRMCQRAFGAFYAPLVIANRLEWTSGTRRLFASSNVSQRGFCGDCGTPLSLENFDDDLLEIATGTLDNPEIAPPTLQINYRYRCSFADGIGKLPEPETNMVADNDAWNAKVVSLQSQGEDDD
ncbi:GFA family protein [Rhodobacteraceae bacterium B1Z28]|uniref:GFA family protein n=1 Tax=Ruegeria haliotis TaxID=2747601 RepID=A0ABX2PUR3_9RHOB|nr:GFA family protein [Ruegeria haliotis]NVO57930.1 GFA family protein [Ruegeria haliotis]